MNLMRLWILNFLKIQQQNKAVPFVTDDGDPYFWVRITSKEPKMTLRYRVDAVTGEFV